MTINRRIALLPVLTIFALAACQREPVHPSKPAIYDEGMCGGQPGWSVSGAESGELMTYNHLQVTPSAILWNGVAISGATLSDYLDQGRALNPRPVTALVPSSKADCSDVEAVRRAMEDRLHCSAERNCVEYPEREWAKRHPPLP
jgi:hypothetical protein